MRINAVLIKKAYRVGHKDYIKEVNVAEPKWEIYEIIAIKGRNLISAAKRVYFRLDGDCKWSDIRAIREPEYDKYIFEGRECTMNSINNILNTRRWRQEMKEFVNNHKGIKVYIYSGEHKQYWMSGGAGYTPDKENAGVYDIIDAWDRVSHCDISKNIQLIDINLSINNCIY